MKKLLLSLLCLTLLLSSAAFCEEEVDAVSSASVSYYFDGIDGDELMEAINSYTGFYAIASVNPDGTPNIAFFIYGMVKLEDKYYVQLGINPNQTSINIENGSDLMAMYGKTPEAFPYASVGARMYLTLVTDEATLQALSAFSPAGFTPYYLEVTKTVPMG